MGRRPEPRTSAEIKAEMEYAKKKEKQTENQYKLLLNYYVYQQMPYEFINTAQIIGK